MTISRRQILTSFPMLVASTHVGEQCSWYLPSPLFQINQRVKAGLDLPETVEVTGIITGLRWKPENWLIEVGWVYEVTFSPNPLLKSGYRRDEFPEFDLEAI